MGSKSSKSPVLIEFEYELNTTLYFIDFSACMNLTYDPYEFAIGLNMLMNEESLFQNRISGE